MMKRILSVALAGLFIFSISSCAANSDAVMKQFEQYTPDHNMVVILDDSSFYFPDHTLDLSEITQNASPNNGYVFVQDKLYYSATRQNGAFDYSFLIYQCDLDGSNVNLVFEKDGYNTHPWAFGEGNTIYLEYYESDALDPSGKIIDSYNILTNVYENVSTGADASLTDYRELSNGEYSIKIEDNAFVITRPETNVINKVDSETLSGSEFASTLENCDYRPVYYNVLSNHIYLVYKIETNDLQYPHLVCEYIPDTNEVLFKSLVLLDDIEYIRVEYISNP